MKTTITISNDIHRNETTVVAETWETTLGEMMAEVGEKELAKACRELCGMKDCTCGGYRGLGVDAEGKEYKIIVAG